VYRRLVDIRALPRMWRVSRIDFYPAGDSTCVRALLGILQGVLLAALASIFLLLGRASQPNNSVSRAASPNRAIPTTPGRGVLRWSVSSRSALKPRLLYINAETILETVLKALRKSSGIKLVACDLSASPISICRGGSCTISTMSCSGHVTFCIVVLMRVRDSLRAEGPGREDGQRRVARTLTGVLDEARPGSDPASGGTAVWTVTLARFSADRPEAPATYPSRLLHASAAFAAAWRVRIERVRP